MRTAFAALATNDHDALPPLMPFDELAALVGLNDYTTAEQRYRIAE
jgi:hypothetical protein